MGVIISNVLEYLENWHKSPKRGNFVTVGHETVADLLGFAKLGQQIQWVSVKNRLPDDGDYDILINGKYGPRVMHVSDFLKYRSKFVTHWMPLPPNPKAVE